MFSLNRRRHAEPRKGSGGRKCVEAAANPFPRRPAGKPGTTAGSGVQAIALALHAETLVRAVHQRMELANQSPGFFAGFVSAIGYLPLLMDGNPRGFHLT